MKLGFTGTQHGMTSQQRIELRRFVLAGESIVEAHHGDCIGSDCSFHRLFRWAYPRAKVVIHPPDNDKKRAYCEGDVTLPTKPYLVRNHDIVDSVDYIVATPSTLTEVRRSGTWATIRYARLKKKPITIIFPDGRVLFENGA